MLTDHQVQLVQSSFAQVVPRALPCVTLFYDKLFEIAPSTRVLFPEDLEAQRAKIVSTLATVVQSLHQLEPLIPTIEGLGERHVAYNVVPEHYGPVGQALLSALEQTLGDAWTDEVRDAWAAAYGALSQVMLRGAARARQAS